MPYAIKPELGGMVNGCISSYSFPEVKKKKKKLKEEEESKEGSLAPPLVISLNFTNEREFDIIFIKILYCVQM